MEGEWILNKEFGLRGVGQEHVHCKTIISTSRNINKDILNLNDQNRMRKTDSLINFET